MRYRPILIEQLRTMGGTRFFVNVNTAVVPVQALTGQPLADGVVPPLGPVAAVPAPSTWAMMLAGLLFVGGRLRRMNEA